MRWVIAVLFALLGATSCGVGFAIVGRPALPTATAVDVRPAFDAERALAIGAGLQIAEEGVTSDHQVSRDLPVAAGECVAVIAVMEGLESLSRTELSLDDGERVSLVGTAPDTLPWMAHHALCARAATTAHVRLRTTEAHSEDGLPPSSLRFAVLRGAVPSPRTYARLTVSDAARAWLDESAVRDREARSVTGGARIGDTIVVHPGSAIVLPSSRATFAGARALIGAPDLAPALAEPHATDPFRAPDDREVVARAHTSTGLARLLAVVDVGALGAPCVVVTVSRLDDPRDWVPVRRIELPSLEETPLTPVDPAVALDTVCPARGLFLYVTDERPGGDYLVGAHAIPGDGIAEPSTFEPTPLPMPEVVVAQARCDAGEARGCVALAGLAAATAPGAGSPRPALERACALSDGEGCDRLAALLGRADAARDRALADGLERQACAVGHAPACLRRAARFREGARDLPAAYQTYRFACGLGAADACAAVSTMDEWQLASAAPSPAAGSPTADSLP